MLYDYCLMLRIALKLSKMPQSGLVSMQGSSSPKKSSPSKACLPLKVVFHQRLSSTKGHLPLKVVFHRRSSSTKGRLPPKVIFHQRLSPTYHNTLLDLIFIFVRTVNIPNLSLLPGLEVASSPKVVFHQWLSSTEGCLPPAMTEQSTYQISASYLA